MIRLTVQIIDPEEELELIVGRLAGELLHGTQELGQRDGATLVAVEDLEHAFGEERLQNY